MSRYAVVSADGTVENVILWDGQAPFEPGGDAIECPEIVSVGWTYLDGEWVAPPEPDYDLPEAVDPS